MTIKTSTHEQKGRLLRDTLVQAVIVYMVYLIVNGQIQVFLPIFDVPIFTRVHQRMPGHTDTNTDICRSLEGNMSVVIWRSPKQTSLYW